MVKGAVDEEDEGSRAKELVPFHSAENEVMGWQTGRTQKTTSPCQALPIVEALDCSENIGFVGFLLLSNQMVNPISCDRWSIRCSTYGSLRNNAAISVA